MARDLNQTFGLHLAQRSVDFVLPRLDADLPLCIDPFLLYKSRQVELQDAHTRLLGHFARVFSAFDQGQFKLAQTLVDLPEASEIRFGYAQEGHSGRGIGSTLGRLILETLEASPALVRRGLRHVEELQLFSVGIGPDRISDLTANVLKDFLVEYTQRQSALWNIPVESGVPLEHVWDQTTDEWVDTFFDLPVDPASDRPILLVPRWIVRRLPWINYDDFAGSTLTKHLRARKGRSGGAIAKASAVEVTRHDVALVDRYVREKEQEAPAARPSDLVAGPGSQPTTTELLEALELLTAGLGDAYSYQRLVLRILTELLEPDLTDGKEQVRTESGVEIRDVILSNDSSAPFLQYVANRHGNTLLVFECKNKISLDADDINQLANYLGDPMGYVGFVVSRADISDAMWRKCIATYAKSSPRKVVLPLSDADIRSMYGARAAGRSPLEVLRRRYRALMEAVD